MRTDTSKKILELLPRSLHQEGYTQETWLAMKVQIKKASVSKALQRLESKGLVKGIGKTTGRYYILKDGNGSRVSPGIQSVRQDDISLAKTCTGPASATNISHNVQSNVQSPKMPPSEVSLTKRQVSADSQADSNSTDRIYCHRLKRTYDLTAQATLSGARMLHLHNNDQQLSTYEGVSYRLTTRKLVLDGIECYDDLETMAPDVQRRAERKADSIALHIVEEQALSVQRGANGEVLGHTSIIEIALTRIEATKRLTERLPGRLIFYTAPNGKEVWTDRTPITGTVETDDATLLPAWQHFAKPLEEGKWSIQGQLELNQGIITDQKSQLQWFKHHDQLTVALTKQTAELTKLVRKLNQRRL